MPIINNVPYFLFGIVYDLPSLENSREVYQANRRLPRAGNLLPVPR
jgi:hypothetical protein